MFEDFLRIATIICLLISGYLIVKKIYELEIRITDIESHILKTKETYEEEYSTDQYFNIIKNPVVVQELDPVYEETSKISTEKVYPLNEEKIDILPEEIIISPTFTENVIFSESENQEEIKKYSKMKLIELQKICTDLNIEIKTNNKNKSKKNLIREIISHLNNNG